VWTSVATRTSVCWKDACRAEDSEWDGCWHTTCFMFLVEYGEWMMIVMATDSFSSKISLSTRGITWPVGRPRPMIGSYLTVRCTTCTALRWRWMAVYHVVAMLKPQVWTVHASFIFRTRRGCDGDTPFTWYNRLSNRLYKWFDKLVVQPVSQLAVSCKQTSNHLSNRLLNRFDNRFENRVERTATVRSTGCQPGCTTGLTTGCIHNTAGC